MHRICRSLSAAGVCTAVYGLLGGCPQTPSEPAWQLVLSDLAGGLLSVSGTSSTDVYAVGADPGDGGGPLVLRYNGSGWSRLQSGASGDLWWITDRLVGDSFFMGGENGLILRFRPSSGAFETQTTPGTETIFGVWGERAERVFAVGGDVNEPDTSGVIWLYDGAQWTKQDTSALGASGIPVLYKVWGRSESEVYACGARGTLLRFDGANWTALPTPTTRTLFTVHGNDSLVVACGGAQSGVIVESTGAAFANVTPAGALQMNGVFVPPSGAPITVGLEGAIAFRGDSGWASDETGLNLDLALDYHAAWIDPQGGIWAVGGNIRGEPRTDGVLAHFGTDTIKSTVLRAR